MAVCSCAMLLSLIADDGDVLKVGAQALQDRIRKLIHDGPVKMCLLHVRVFKRYASQNGMLERCIFESSPLENRANQCLAVKARSWQGRPVEDGIVQRATLEAGTCQGGM